MEGQQEVVEAQGQSEDLWKTPQNSATSWTPSPRPQMPFPSPIIQKTTSIDCHALPNRPISAQPSGRLWRALWLLGALAAFIVIIVLAFIILIWIMDHLN